MNAILTFTVSTFILSLLICSGCQQQSPPAQTLPRPVKVFRVSGSTTTPQSFAAEVQARHETLLSFRVPGKVTNRPVDIGDKVDKGQLLAQLDGSDYQLAVQGLQAQLKAASAERDFIQADWQRYRELLKQKVISAPDFDKHETAYTAAQEKVTGLKAQLAQARNQLRYTELHADRDGVVLALATEVGQVVAAGQTLIKLAQQNDKEIHFDIPEHQVAALKPNQSVEVSLWATGGQRFKAKIREIAVAADPVSRTYRVKATLLEGLTEARLGMTATVLLPTDSQITPAAPLSAVFTPQDRPEQARVWLVDETAQTIKSLPVQIGEPRPDEQVAVFGINAGQLLVSAGVQRLHEGQAVRLPEPTEAQP